MSQNSKRRAQRQRTARRNRKHGQLSDVILQERFAMNDLFTLLERGCPAAVTPELLRDANVDTATFFDIAVRAPGGFCWWTWPA